MMKTYIQEDHAKLSEEMENAREWMSRPERTKMEFELHYASYKKLVDKITQMEKIMWEPMPW